MLIYAVVPARAGSKGLKNKNILEAGDTSLLEHAVSFGKSLDFVDQVIVSTDSEDYEKKALSRGAMSLGLRPERLAGDKVKTVDVILDLLTQLEGKLPAPDALMLLQPTSPIRTLKMAAEAIELLKGADAVVSVGLLEEPHPYKLKKLGQSGFIEPFIDGASSETPRQMLPKAYFLTGCLYLIKTDVLKSEKTFLPQRTAPLVCEPPFVNIDTSEDFDRLKSLIESGQITLQSGLA